MKKLHKSFFTKKQTVESMACECQCYCPCNRCECPDIPSQAGMGPAVSDYISQTSFNSGYYYGSVT